MTLILALSSLTTLNLRKLTSKRFVSQKLSPSKRREAPAFAMEVVESVLRFGASKLRFADSWQMAVGIMKFPLKMIVQTVKLSTVPETWNFSRTSSENWMVPNDQMIERSVRAIVSYNSFVAARSSYAAANLLLETSWLQTSVEMQLRWSGSAWQQPEQWWWGLSKNIQKQPSNPKRFMNAIPKKP